MIFYEYLLSQFIPTICICKFEILVRKPNNNTQWYVNTYTNKGYGNLKDSKCRGRLLLSTQPVFSIPMICSR